LIHPTTNHACLYLIRHGETAWSLTGQHTGRSDIPLTEHGEQEAIALTKPLASISFAKVLTSPRIRARRTCELVGLAPLAEVDADLSEWDYGDYDGKRSSDIKTHRPDWNLYRDGCPQGESPSQVSQRVDRLIDRLSQWEGNIALFTHGHLGSVLAARWISLPLIEAQHFVLKTASLSILSHNPHHPEIRVIQLWNSKSSLFS
jgi:broad specificity phosphatase PhoE